MRCRSVYVAAPVIPAALEDEFEMNDPAVYVAAVERALATWGREMEGWCASAWTIRRTLASRSGCAARRRSSTANARCSAARGSRTPASSRARSRRRAHARAFEAGPLTIFVADEFGLLSADQVSGSLHGIGHALNMRAHSPIPADLMYEVLRDRVLVREGSRPRTRTPSCRSTAAERDDLRGCRRGRRRPSAAAERAADARARPASIRATASRQAAVRLDARGDGQGVAAVDGVTWDRASYQVVVSGQPSLDAYLSATAPGTPAAGACCGPG
jgi:hypothetical protein